MLKRRKNHINSREIVSNLTAAQHAKEPEKIVEQQVFSGMYQWFRKNYPEVNVEQSAKYKTDGFVIIPGKSGLFGTQDDTTAFTEKRVLLEAKQDLNFSGNEEHRIDAIAQVCAYLRIFHDSGEVVPQVSVIADVDEIFFVPTAVLEPIVKDPSIDYYAGSSPEKRKITPSAAKNIADLRIAIRENTNLNPHVLNINKGFNFNEFFSVVDSVLTSGKLDRIQISTLNMERLFDDYSHKAFPDAMMDVSNQKKIDIFIRTMKGDKDVYLKPTEMNIIVVDGKEYPIDSYQHESFWNMYDNSQYSLDEIKAITEIADTLIEEVDRRFKGDYWTPTIWVDHAHRLIEKQLGENWREDYVVWDPAAGSKNLTRDYAFGELYSSTLHQEELNISSWYNKNNVAFQYDFLNDDMILHSEGMTRDMALQLARSGALKMPAGIVEALYENRPFVFFANPPYGQATSAQGNAHKSGVTNTAVGGMMGRLGHAKRELYTQFIYRVQLLADLFEYKESFHFFFFNKGFLTSSSFGNFIDGLTAQFTYCDGFMLNAGEFNGTSSAWGIIFSHWDIDNKLEKNQDKFTFNVCKSNCDARIEKIDTWIGVLVDKEDTIGFWSRKNSERVDRDMDAPITKNGFDIPDQPNTNCRIYHNEKWIGYFVQDSSNIQGSGKYTGMYSMGLKRGAGETVTEDNITISAITFSIRRSVQEVIARQKQLWIRDKDVFSAPPEDLITPEFTAGCMVYSLFDRQSNQTSLRDYKYNGKSYRVVNQFFPFSMIKIRDLAEKHYNMDIQEDLQSDQERIMCQWLENHAEDISPEAREVLDYAWFLLEESFPLREKYKRAYSLREARYQTNTWDAGWVQIYRLIFGKDRIDNSMIQYKEEWDKRVRVLGDKIATAAMDAGVI